MSEQQRKGYDAEFTRNAVRLADSSEKGDSIVERELGVHQGVIGTWRRALRDDSEAAFPGTVHMKPQEKEIRRLRREL